MMNEIGNKLVEVCNLIQKLRRKVENALSKAESVYYQKDGDGKPYITEADKDKLLRSLIQYLNGMNEILEELS